MHYSVMKQEVLNNLSIKEDGIYVDGTIGLAGHSSEILKKIKTGHLYGFDQDEFAIEKSQEKLKDISNNYTLIHSNFVNMKEELQKLGVEKVDGILLDLGVSSPQIDNKERGFSFMKDATLDMRMDSRNTLNAKTIVNTYDLNQLLDIFYNYGEERYSKLIANKIINYRKNKEIDSTLELVDIIKSSVPVKYFIENHPERKIFQALRIEVNKELTVLEKVLPDAIHLLNKGGRLVVITFHSLEDRIVKKIFKEYSEVDDMVRGLPYIPEGYEPLIKLINHKPIVATDKEINENSRSKSAKIRVIERL
mgnify:CR=1 FL=1